MMRRGFIENDVADHDKELFAPAGEPAGQGVLADHVNQSFAHPGPELLLSSPELILVCADYPGSLLSFHRYDYPLFDWVGRYQRRIFKIIGSSAKWLTYSYRLGSERRCLTN